MKRIKFRLRIVLSLVLIIIAVIPVAWYLLTNSARNAPLVIGSDATPLATSDTPTEVEPLPHDLLFMSDAAGDWDLLLLQTDGTLINLTQDGSGAQDLLGAWSFDGDTINSLSNRADPTDLGPSQLNASEPSEVRTLTLLSAVFTMFREQQFDWDPLWSPDGSQLLWISVRDLNLELYRIDTAADFTIDNMQRVTDTGGREWYPSWSPDGTKLLYNSDAAGNEDIFMLDFATGTSTQLTTHEADDIRGLWSLDGTQIAFASERDEVFTSGVMRLYVMNTDGTDLRPLTNDILFEGGATWSEGATHVVYNSNHEGSWQLYLMRADGSNLRRLTDGNANYLLPSWRP